MATGRIGTTPVLQVRWSKAPSADTTSLSGLDDNSVSLVYSVGYEAVYRNGVLLSRTNDYTATDGTTITLIDATIAGDIIEVFANQTIPLADTYSQTVADGKFINNTLTTTTGDIIYASAANTPARLEIGSTGQVLKVSGGVPSWGADGGKVLQVVSASTTTSTTIATSTYTDTTITATITPTLATSKILVIISAHSQTNKTASGAIILGKARVLRDATSIFESLRYTFLEGATVNTLELGYQGGITYLDSPATTSATTYKMQAGIVTGSEIVFQQGGNNQSTISLLEIGA